MTNLLLDMNSLIGKISLLHLSDIKRYLQNCMSPVYSFVLVELVRQIL